MGLRLHAAILIDGVEDHRRWRSKSMESEKTRLDRLIGGSMTDRYSQWFREALDELPDCFLITDPSIPGHPIVFASRGFLGLTGYAEAEVLGRNGRMFQGPETDRRSVSEIREAIRGERTVQVELLNYRKDGRAYRVWFHLCPVFGREDGRVVHFVAVQVPISGKGRGAGWEIGRGRRCSGGEERYGSCRRELFLEMIGELGGDRVFLGSDDKGLGSEESCEASVEDKEKASVSVNNILSALIRYSELTGRRVSGKKCSDSVGIVPLGSSLTISLGRIKQSFVLTDPHLHDMPIVYVSEAFLSLTGYSRNEVLGRNCRFLSGPGTDVGTLCEIRENIRTEQASSVRILNYRKDGSSFWNLLHISPVRNARGKIAFYVGVQTDESAKTDAQGLSPEMRQLGTVGAVKVAVRSLSAGVGPSKSS
ncbi:Protein TWIN LOV 1 [Acorus calamus]|uniref:Protein TWIN LOV 1 n=1 Tax=Acorus calamus TaxID=4465 RepID=A0AAV9EDT8_ACOCL|nr:Protein TWIN LOV 1 [Acorus calamus]